MSAKTNPFAVGGVPITLNDVALRQLSNVDPKLIQALMLANIAALVTGAFAALSITLSLDTSIYASGDVLADTQAIAGAVRTDGGSAILRSLSLVDKDDNAAAGIDLVFLGSNVSLGTENAAPSISDANADSVLGIVSVASGDFIDLGGVKVATVKSIGLQLTPASGTTVYVAAITRGTPTQTASGIVLNLQVEQE